MAACIYIKTESSIPSSSLEVDLVVDNDTDAVVSVTGLALLLYIELPDTLLKQT